VTTRRAFVITITGGLAGTALSAGAQPTDKPARLGMLLTGSPSNPRSAPEVEAFMQALRQLGWSEGQNLLVERRWTDTPDSFPGLAADLVRLSVDIILTPGPDATRAAREAMTTIPIVMVASTDPRQVGAASFARPGGNLTGLTVGQPELTGEKRLELLKETLPRLSRVAVVWDVRRTQDANESSQGMISAARTLGLRLQQLDVNSPSDFERAFKAAKQDGAGALLLVESPRAVANRAVIAELGMKNRLPLMSQFRPIVEAGGLMSYGPDLPDLFRRAAGYVDKILKGARPVDLPIEQPTKFALVINSRTAKALGLTIPPSVLLRADEVLQ
jgi:putative ABC transport system substrate-binding protein